MNLVSCELCSFSRDAEAVAVLSSHLDFLAQFALHPQGISFMKNHFSNLQDDNIGLSISNVRIGEKTHLKLLLHVWPTFE